MRNEATLFCFLCTCAALNCTFYARNVACKGVARFVLSLHAFPKGLQASQGKTYVQTYIWQAHAIHEV
jgi:hypothetical protein